MRALYKLRGFGTLHLGVGSHRNRVAASVVDVAGAVRRELQSSESARRVASVRDGLGLDQIRAFSRLGTLATMLVYRDERDRMATQRRLTDVVAGTLQP